MTGNATAPPSSFSPTELEVDRESSDFHPRAALSNLTGQLKTSLAVVPRAWDRFWFHPADPYPLAILRLLAGGMLFYSHLVWGIDLQAFFGSSGWNNAGLIGALQNDSFAWSFWWYVPDAWLMPVHVMCCLVLLMFFLGAFTRVTSVLSWLIAISYAHRAMLANYGLDQIVCMLVLYLCLSPCNHYLSLDAWWRRWRRGEVNRIEPSIMANLSCRLIQVHLCVIYLFAGLSKLQGRSWWNGNAVWEALANEEYQSTDMTWLAAFPLITHIATHMTIAWEVSFWALVWNRYLRPFVLLIGTSMHLGIGMFMGMWTFGLAMTFGYVTFIPAAWLRMLIHGVARIPAASCPVARPREASDNEFTSDPDFQAAIPAPRTGYREPGNQQVGTPALIVVCKSMTTGLKVLRYFDHYGQRVSLVDGMIQARQLCKSLRHSVVICLDPHFNEEERQHWVDQVGSENPSTSFVFVCRHVEASPATGNVRIIKFVFTLREIRQAVESLIGRPMSPVDTQSDKQPAASVFQAGLHRPLDAVPSENAESKYEPQDTALYELTADPSAKDVAPAPRLPR